MATMADVYTCSDDRMDRHSLCSKSRTLCDGDWCRCWMTTSRDSIFLVCVLVTGVFVKRWWHLLIAAITVSIAYTFLFNGSPLILDDGSLRWWPFIGRLLSMIIVCSAIALVIDLCRKILGLNSSDINKSEDP